MVFIFRKSTLFVACLSEYCFALNDVINDNVFLLNQQDTIRCLMDPNSVFQMLSPDIIKWNKCFAVKHK